jgi:hypothetical protein
VKSAVTPSHEVRRGCIGRVQVEVPETDSDKADRLRDDFRQAVHEFLAPDFFPQELTHALTRTERQGRIGVGQAAIFWADAMTTPPMLVPSLP